MRTMGLILLLIVAGGCAGRSETAVQQDSAGDESKAADVASCNYSSALDVAENGDLTPGCHVTADAKVCEVSNGATVSQDGGVSNGTESCKPLCAQGQYPVECVGEGVMRPIPQLPTGLSCQPGGLPTPSSEMSYCCPCGG
jgi:hypothetical protein